MAIEYKSDTFPILLSLPEQNVKAKFFSSEDVSDFFARERDFWTSIPDRLQSSKLADGNMQAIAKQLGAVQLQEATQQFDGTFEGARNALGGIQSRGLILSEGRQGKRLSEIAVSHPALVSGYMMGTVASWGLRANIQRLPSNIQNPQGQVSNIGAAFLELGTKGKGADRKPVIDKLIADLQSLRTEISASKTDFDEWNQTHTAEWTNKLTDFQSELESSAAVQKENAESQISQASTDLEKAVAKSQSRIEELEKQVKERLLMEAPTTYWRDKAKGHNWAAFLFGAAFAAILGVGVWWISAYGVDYVAYATDRVIGDRDSSSLAALVPLAFITIPALGVAWLLRHLSRLVIQNLALGADARLRGTIALTYAALTHEGSATEAQLAIALNALFRPIDSKDHVEIAPPTLEDILNITRKKD